MRTIAKKIGFCFALCCGLIWHSCKKDEIHAKQVGMARVNVINAVVSSAGMHASNGDVKVNVSAKKVIWSSILDYNYLGQWQPFGMFIAPTEQPAVLQVVPTSDTTKMWYDQVTQLNAGKVYTLYLSGIPTNVKTRFKEETNFPKYIARDASKSTKSADSIVNIRFVNLSPSGPKVDIKIANSNTLEASNLGYQEYTDFKSFSARTSSSIRFEIINAADKSLVMTYDFNTDYNRFKTISLVLKGIYPIDYSLPYTSTYQITEVPY